jgi:hypothetical protein
MSSAEIAAIVDPTAQADSVASLVDFFGIPGAVFPDIAALAASVRNGLLENKRFAVIGALPSLHAAEPLAAGLTSTAPTLGYGNGDVLASAACLQALVAKPVRILPVNVPQTLASITAAMPEFTGPLHNLTVSTKVDKSAHVVSIGSHEPDGSIITVKQGTVFFRLPGAPVFVTIGTTVPDLNQPVNGHFYDVREHFLTVAPFVMFLKWAFRDVCWMPRESGACLIVDDPLLRPKYGFFDFSRIDQQMRQHSFTTNIAFIPWNRRRTSQRTIDLVRSSAGRLSLSVHGCDHTAGEFAVRHVPLLNMKAALARARMEELTARTGIPHELVMVFPQGRFSRESMEVLQSHRFVAVVNTEITPDDGLSECPTVRDCWDVALLRYGNLALFTRRYPWHGLENFAFDLLLGKPCLMVEHHEFFKDDGRNIVNFIDTLNALNCQLQWRSLSDVLERSYKWKRADDGMIRVRMFANKLVLENESPHDRSYRVEKADHGRVVTFDVRVGAGDRTMLDRTCRTSNGATTVRQSAKVRAKVALRRYLSEIRDNYVSRIR